MARNQTPTLIRSNGRGRDGLLYARSVAHRRRSTIIFPPVDDTGREGRSLDLLNQHARSEPLFVCPLAVSSSPSRVVFGGLSPVFGKTNPKFTSTIKCECQKLSSDHIVWVSNLGEVFRA